MNLPPEKPYHLARRKGARVSTFGPAIMDALLAGTRDPGATITFPSLHMALLFRRRLYELRAAMEREHHPDFSIALSVKVFLNKGATKDHPATIILAPADREFDSIIRAAGIAPRTDTQPLLPDIDTLPTSFDNLLKDLK